jgi:hypothetical protein
VDRRPQQQTLSIRISDSLRDFLERSKQIISAARQENVSTSDVAKLLLESAKDDRLDLRMEVAELAERPTDALVAFRRKMEIGQPRSRAEWIFAAQYIQVACEKLTGNPLSPGPEVYVSLLEALLAVRKLRADRGLALDRYYLGELIDNTSWNERKFDKDVLPNAIDRLIEEIRSTGNGKVAAGVGRCLYVAMRDEEFSDTVALNHALDKFQNTLLRMAARGHWIREERPLRTTRDGPLLLPTVMPMHRGSRHLSVSIGQTDISFAISIDSADLVYTISGYAQIREFQAMLHTLKPDSIWDGPSFHGLATPSGTNSAAYQFRRRQDGVMLGFNEENWQSLRELIQEAMEQPALQTVFREMSLIYGEL